MRAQGFQVGGEFLLGILVVLGIPADPVGRAQLEQILQILFLESLGTDDVDLLDLRRIALFDLEVDRHAIAFERRDRRGDRHRILAARQVLALQFLLGLVQHAPVKSARDGKADVLQALDDLIFLELLHPDKVDLRDGRTFFDGNDHHVASDLDAHILEEAGGKQGLDRLRRLLVGHGFADFHREIAENRSRFSPLNAIDADILDRKGLEGMGTSGQQHRDQPRQERFFHTFSQKSSD